MRSPNFHFKKLSKEKNYYKSLINIISFTKLSYLTITFDRYGYEHHLNNLSFNSGLVHLRELLY